MSARDVFTGIIACAALFTAFQNRVELATEIFSVRERGLRVNVTWKFICAPAPSISLTEVCRFRIRENLGESQILGLK